MKGGYPRMLLLFSIIVASQICVGYFSKGEDKYVWLKRIWTSNAENTDAERDFKNEKLSETSSEVEPRDTKHNSTNPTLNETKVSHEAPDLPRCGHILLFSAPRHGSTWLVDNAEQCRFRKGGKYKKAIENSELWIPHHKLLANATVTEALDHLENVCSLKIFPTVFHREDAAEELISRAKEKGVPMIVLTRPLKSVYVSFVKARAQKKWNKVTSGGKDAESIELDEEDDGFVSFSRQMERHFSRIRDMLQRLEVKNVDMFGYEDIRDEEFIVAKKNGCYIQNCNFL